jgi:hypothetical protein
VANHPSLVAKKKVCSDMPNVVSANSIQKTIKYSRQAANSQSLGFAINISHAQ